MSKESPVDKKSLPLVPTPEAKAEIRKANTFLKKYENFEIVEQGHYDVAVEDLKEVKSKYNKLDSLEKFFTKPLEKTKKDFIAFFKGPKMALKEVEDKIKRGIIAWDEKKEQERKEEQERIEKEREKEKKKLERKAEKAEEKGDTEKADELRQQAEDVDDFIPEAGEGYEKADGVSLRDNWVAEVVDLMELVKAVAKGKAPLSFLQENTTVLNKQAKATKNAVNYPGVRFVNKKNMAVRS